MSTTDAVERRHHELEDADVGSTHPTSGGTPDRRWADRSWLARLRAGLLVAYGIVYVWWFFTYGVIIDRISVGVSVVVFLLIAHIGKPWREWARLPLDLGLYALMWFLYDETRGAADRVGLPLQVDSVIIIDRVIFLGVDPTVWLQQQFATSTVRFYDVIASIAYFSHFIVPVIVVAVLWVANRRQWIRFMKRFATMLTIACVMFVLLPTAPPWMAAGGSRRIPLDSLPELRRGASRGWTHLGFEGFVHTWISGRDWANPTAAMPSLHAAFSLFVVVFFFPAVQSWRWRVVMLMYPLIMGLSLVYLAEHYVIDVLAGWAVIGVSFLVWNRIERRRTTTEAEGEASS